MIWPALDVITCLALWSGWYVVTLNRIERRESEGDEFDQAADLARDPPRLGPDPMPGPPRPHLPDGLYWHQPAGGEAHTSSSPTCSACRVNWERRGVLLPHRRWHEGRW